MYKRQDRKNRIYAKIYAKALGIEEKRLDITDRSSLPGWEVFSYEDVEENIRSLLEELERKDIEKIEGLWDNFDTNKQEILEVGKRCTLVLNKLAEKIKFHSKNINFWWHPRLKPVTIVYFDPVERFAYTNPDNIPEDIKNRLVLEVGIRSESGRAFFIIPVSYTHLTLPTKA